MKKKFAVGVGIVSILTLGMLTVQASDNPHTVVFDGTTGSNLKTWYTLKASGRIEQVDGMLDGHRVTRNDNDKVDGGTARGLVGNAKDGYRVHGRIQEISLEKPGVASVFVDGRLFHTVVIDGTKNPGKGTDYVIQVAGKIRQVDDVIYGRKVTRNPDDKVRGSGAKGFAGRARDGYYVFGDIRAIALENPGAAAVFVDGKPYANTVKMGKIKKTGQIEKASSAGGISGGLGKYISARGRHLDPPGNSGACRSVYDVAGEVLERLEAAAKEVGCPIASAAASGSGAALDVEACIVGVNAVRDFQEYSTLAWNALVARNGWSNLGPRDLKIGDRVAGTIRGFGDRKFITVDFLGSDSIRLDLSEVRGRNETRVVVCKQDQRGTITELDNVVFNDDRSNRDRDENLNRTYRNMRNRQLIIFLNGLGKPDPGRQLKYVLETGS